MSHKGRHSLVERFNSLHHFSQYQNLGRYRLAQLLGLTRDQTRPILEYLVFKRLIKKISRRKGHSLTQEGNNFILWTKKFFFLSPQRVYFGSDFTVGANDAVVCLDADGVDHLNTVVLRDEALLAGSKGCTVFFQTSEDHIFLLDVVYPPLPSSPVTSRKIRKLIKTVTKDLSWKNTIVVVGTGDSFPLAQKGAMAASLLFISEDIKKVLL